MCSVRSSPAVGHGDEAASRDLVGILASAILAESGALGQPGLRLDEPALVKRRLFLGP